MDQPVPSEDAVLAAIGGFQDPETGRPVGTTGQIRHVSVDGPTIAVTLGLTSYAAPIAEQVRAELESLLRARFPGAAPSVVLAPHQRPAEPQGQIGVPAKSVVAVGSGKGGVGKSSVAAWLAVGLRRAGAKVGLLDADVYGPSLPHLLGAQQRPFGREGRIEPVVVEGVKLMSIGLLVPREDAVIWRGPMLHSALTQLLRDTAWDDVDYLIVDMPPGTGDLPISLSQLLPSAVAVVVCTPQDVALLDAVKAVDMFRKVQLAVVGMVENMSYFVCPACSARHEIFGSGGAERRAGELGIPFLGRLPLDEQLRRLGDEGRVAAAFEHPSAAADLEAICRRLVGNLVAARRTEPPRPTLPIIE